MEGRRLVLEVVQDLDRLFAQIRAFSLSEDSQSNASSSCDSTVLLPSALAASRDHVVEKTVAIMKIMERLNVDAGKHAEVMLGNMICMSNIRDVM